MDGRKWERSSFPSIFTCGCHGLEPTPTDSLHHLLNKIKSGLLFRVPGHQGTKLNTHMPAFCEFDMDVSKNRNTPKMDGENNGKPYEQMDDLGGVPPIFGNTPMETLDFFLT